MGEFGGEEIRHGDLVTSADPMDVMHDISQISDVLKSRDEGYIDLWEYDDLFELIQEHDVESWCSQRLKTLIADARKRYHRIILDISDERVS